MGSLEPLSNADLSRRAGAAVREERLWGRLMEMAKLGATPKGGVCRQAFTPEDNAARRLYAGWGKELGLECWIDGIGNVILRRSGADPEAAPIMTGSHLDSQPTGGKYDGAYGVLGGLEALQALIDAGIETRRPIDVVAWANEEGGRFSPGCMGSAVFSGKSTLESLLPLTDWDGVTIETELTNCLKALDCLERRDHGYPVHGYVEIHIEQGPRLEAGNTTIGIVTGIQGSRRYVVEVIGEEAHAGTTPLKGRKDALKAAAEMVGALEALTEDPEDIARFTVGRFDVSPGSPNTVPGKVVFSIDFRHPDGATMARLCDRFEAVCKAHARGCAITVARQTDSAPVAFDPAVVDALSVAATDLELSQMRMPSGAGHDAGLMARVCAAGMVFVPCAGGVSHNETESATPSDLADGARVLAAWMANAANS